MSRLLPELVFQITTQTSQDDVLHFHFQYDKDIYRNYAAQPLGLSAKHQLFDHPPYWKTVKFNY